MAYEQHDKVYDREHNDCQSWMARYVSSVI